MCRGCGSVLAVGGLLGYAEHSADLQPATAPLPGICDRSRECLVDFLLLVDQHGDCPHQLQGGWFEIFRLALVSPLLKRGQPVRKLFILILIHHSPFHCRNFPLAGIA